MLALYVITIFLSAGLLFLVQPMFAKMVLPLLGGSPAVWNTCMVFFQAALLAGYAYAHLSIKLLGARKQAVVHVIVLLLPLLVLPLAVPAGWTPPATGLPIGWLLGLLTIAMGLPFFVVASHAPMLQTWFAASGHRTAGDPYHLYAASNLGSMLALLAYPMILEPAFGLRTQSGIWSGGYGLLAGMVGLCAIGMWVRSRRGGIPVVGEADATIGSGAPAKISDAPVTWRRRLHWIALAAVPSSLMLGVTTYITTDIAVVPLLWVIPLALYLLTFIIVFARRQVISPRWVVRLFPVAAIMLLVVLVSRSTDPVALVTFAHLAAFFLAALMCHGLLARDRPDPKHLTEFYLLMSVGGVVGGMFNGLIAPVVFTGIAEYPIALVGACLLMPHMREFFPGATFASSFLRRGAAPSVDATPDADALAVAARRTRVLDVAAPIVVFCVAVALVGMANRMSSLHDMTRLAVIGAAPAMLCFLCSERPLRFGLAVAAVLLAGGLSTAKRGDVLEMQRSFFGVNRVSRIRRTLGEDVPGRFLNQLYHGTTLHGMQWIDPETRLPIESETPLTYYHRKGPMGQVFRAYPEGRFSRVGIVGLGAGGLFAYAGAGAHFTSYEIDPIVQGLAEDAALFTFLSAARERGAQVDIELGDARLSLADVDDGEFDLLILDAFSSDAIPVHLLTVEAGRLYEQKLAPGGLLAFHISNRYLNLKPVMAALAESLGMACVDQDDQAVSADEKVLEGRERSHWVVMARSRGDLVLLNPGAIASPWELAVPEMSFRPWTDDYSNIFDVFMWDAALGAD